MSDDLKKKLEEAEAAYHRLAIGEQTVSISKDGRAVQFSAANITQLRNYIEYLKQQLGLKGNRRGPARVGL